MIRINSATYAQIFRKKKNCFFALYCNFSVSLIVFFFSSLIVRGGLGGGSWLWNFQLCAGRILKGNKGTAVQRPESNRLVATSFSYKVTLSLVWWSKGKASFLVPDLLSSLAMTFKLVSTLFRYLVCTTAAKISGSSSKEKREASTTLALVTSEIFKQPIPGYRDGFPKFLRIDAQESPEKVLDPVELEFWEDVSQSIGAGNQTLVLWQSSMNLATEPSPVWLLIFSS